MCGAYGGSSGTAGLATCCTFQGTRAGTPTGSPDAGSTPPINAAAVVPRCAGDACRHLNGGDADRAVGCRVAGDAVHGILLAGGRARGEAGKKRRRSYVRYERKHSSTLWHADYTQPSDGRWLIMYEDDSSRFITGCGMFENATPPNAVAP